MFNVSVTGYLRNRKFLCTMNVYGGQRGIKFSFLLTLIVTDCQAAELASKALSNWTELNQASGCTTPTTNLAAPTKDLLNVKDKHADRKWAP
jgi:hypothetical protein